MCVCIYVHKNYVHINYVYINTHNLCVHKYTSSFRIDVFMKFSAYCWCSQTRGAFKAVFL